MRENATSAHNCEHSVVSTLAVYTFNNVSVWLRNPLSAVEADPISNSSIFYTRHSVECTEPWLRGGRRHSGAVWNLGILCIRIDLF